MEVRTTAGTYAADTVVVAAGVWSRELCRSLGVRLDLAAGKGYSFSVHGVAAAVADRGVDAAVADVRVAGTMEFDRDPDRFRQGRVDALAAATRRYLPGADWDRREQEWMGARPMTPDGLPVTGPPTGHNMLGLMPAPVTGRLIAGWVTGDADPELAGRFSPTRW
ncbi:FAD-binding oxidoreductase [Streptomyces sp. NPDC048420]|uniref:NAD(P)/FAD-dependent oxidoreductase n=1 Tax=Streptomyces sp. NPDC048420 TaxID=3155755 RepID=UPI003417FFD9